MNREIKFRGRRLDTGEWVYGYLCENTNGEICIQEIVRKVINGFAVPNRLHPVNPATIGQYTGMRDKNGKEIYEGDIIEINYKYEYQSVQGVIPDQDCICVGIVTYMEDSLRFTIRLIKAEFPLNREFEDAEYVYVPFEIFDFEGIEIIGNIHDNKNLLED